MDEFTSAIWLSLECASLIVAVVANFFFSGLQPDSVINGLSVLQFSL
jgi:hypothetical protein